MRVFIVWLLFLFSVNSCWAKSENTNLTKAKERIELQCGSHKAVITCGKAKPGDPSDERVCVRNKLSLQGSDGNFRQIPTPKKYERKQGTAATLACQKDKNGKNYLVVGYSFCSVPVVCKVHDIYDLQGKRLTTQEKRADQEYDRVSGLLGLSDVTNELSIEDVR